MEVGDAGPNSCRVCLTRTPKLRSLYQPLDDGEKPPYKMLHLITGITLEKADVYETLPKYICKNCELSLCLAYQFRVKALNTQRLIEDYRYQAWSTNEKEKKAKQWLEIFVKEECEDLPNDAADLELLNFDEDNNEMKIERLDFSLDFSDHDDNDMENEEKQILELTEDECKPEYLEELHSESNMLSTSSGTEIRVMEESRSSNGKSDDSLDIGYAKYVAKFLNNSQESSDIEISSGLSAYSPPVKKPAKKSYYKKKIKSNDNKAHICDVCGNIYAKRGRMMEHRRRHDKELRYACELCDKRFHLLEKLRKHMYIHKGGKPFKCSYCSRTFFYKSVKKAHEAIHSGIKPYVCDVCNKAFAYAHALGKHKLIHTDVKLYHCEYCDKDFRLQHHMKQHLETKSHQNAVRAFKMADEGGEEKTQQEETYQEEGFDGGNTMQENLNELVENIMN